MRSSSFLFIVSSVDAACFTTSESSFKRRSFVRCKAFLEAKTTRLGVDVAVLERYCTVIRLKRENKIEPQHKHHNSSRLFLWTRISSFSHTDFIVFALFTYCLHWNFNLYKYLTEQSQKY